MKFDRKLIIIFYIILVNVSYAWWDEDFEYCRDLTLNEAIGVQRTYEVVDIVLNTSQWENKPSENSIRLVDSNCYGNGREIPYQIFNETANEGKLENFNLIFEANSSEFEKKVYSIYYSIEPKDKPIYDPITVVEQRRSWWIETENYHFYYSLRSDEGLTVLKYVKDGDFLTNYAGTYSTSTPYAVLQAGPKGRFKALSTGPLCFIYQRGDGSDKIIFKICKNSEAVIAEYLEGNTYYITNFVRSSLFYDPDSEYGLYYRTNLDSELKPSSHRFKTLNGFKFGIANTTKGTNFITAITGDNPDYSTESLWSFMLGVDYGRLLSTTASKPWKKALFAVTSDNFDKAFEKAENLRLSLDYPLSMNFSIDDEKSFEIKTDRPLIITNYDYENYVESVLTGNPVLIYENNREFIDYFIREYNPETIFQLDTNLEINNSYYLNSVEDLNKIFPKLKLKQPKTTDYIILSNNEKKESMFSIPLSLNKNGFLINVTGDPEKSKKKLISNLRKINISDSYIFDQNVYLILIGVTKFLVNDPVSKDEIFTDTPYGDINGDDYLDLSVGRLSGSPESISFQIEFPRIFEEKKTALILSSYNVPAKYFDVMVAGGTMKESWKTELNLLRKDFEVTKLVEWRSDYEELNFSVIDRLNDFSNLFNSLFHETYDSFLGQMLGSFNKILLLAKVGDFLLYSLYEFDWVDSWKSLETGSLVSPKHLPILNESNLLENTPRNQVIIYYSKGNSTHWFLPINASMFSAYYEPFDPNLINFNPAFYYLKYDNSIEISHKIFDRGSIGLLSLSGKTSNLQSGRTASLFFENFDKPVGESLKIVKNWNLQISNSSDLSRNKYKREYYTHELLSDPSLTLDPQLNIKQNQKSIFLDGRFITNFVIEPDYKFVDIDDKKLLIFENFDYEIIDEDNPPIPVYTKSFILPTNSKIINISVKPKNSRTYNLDLIQFGNFSFSDYWPKEIFWSTQIRTMDNRTDLDLFFYPIVYYQNGTIEIFNEIDVIFSYQNPLEITSINVDDIYLNDNAKINFSIFSNFNDTISPTLFFLIENINTSFEISKEYEINSGLNQLSFDFNNTQIIGNYSISLALRFDDHFVGPKYSHFNIRKKSIPIYFTDVLSPLKSKISFGLGSFLKTFQMFDEKISVERKGSNFIIRSERFGKNIFIQSDSFNKTSVIIAADKKLLIYDSPNTLKIILQSPEGLLVIEKKNGIFEKHCNGDYRLLQKKLSEMLEIYYEETAYIKKRIS